MAYLPQVPIIDIEVPMINTASPQAAKLAFVAPLFDRAVDIARCLPARKFGNMTFVGTGTTRTIGRVGRCIDLNGSGHLTGDTANFFGGRGITVTGFVSCRTASTDLAFIFTSGIIVGMNSAGSGATSVSFQLYNTAGTGSAVSAEFTNARRSVQDMFFFASRYRLTDNKADFCANGEFQYGVTGVTITPSAGVINIGYFPGFGWSNNGQMRDMRVYSDLLSDTQILRIMHNPNELYAPSDEDFGAVISRNKMFNLFH